MTEDIRIGDWVFLDDEDEGNRKYHEIFRNRFCLEFNKKYLVVGVRCDIVYLEPTDGHNHHYTCYTRRVRLSNHLEETVLWK